MAINTVMVEGNLTKDAELRFTAGGFAVCNFSIAHNRMTGKGESKKESVTFLDVTLWNKAAEWLAENVHKGDKVLIVGRLEQESWEKDGQKRSKIKITAESVYAMPRMPKDEKQSEGQESEGREMPPAVTIPSAPVEEKPASAPKQGAMNW